MNLETGTRNLDSSQPLGPLAGGENTVYPLLRRLKTDGLVYCIEFLARTMRAVLPRTASFALQYEASRPGEVFDAPGQGHESRRPARPRWCCSFAPTDRLPPPFRR